MGNLGKWTCAVLMACSAMAQTPESARLRQGFAQPPDDARVMMRWWWFGPSATKAELEREMRVMKSGGIGGVEIQSVYPLSPDDPAHGLRNYGWLSPEHLDALRFTAEKGRELGLRVDLTLGSGWPFGGPQVPVTQAAGKLRVERVAAPAGTRRVKVPAMEAGESLIAAFVNGKQATAIRDGVLTLDSQGGGDVQFFISSRTGQQVKRAAAGAEGFVFDHYDPAAFAHYFQTVADPMIAAFGVNKPYAVFCDSLEVYGSDWTPDLMEQFRKRRGYDLTPHLPALVGDTPDTLALRRDWGKTLSELVEENFYAPLKDWAAKQGTRFRIQGYGIPPAMLSSYRLADLPEGEGAQWKVVRATRWASSASHIFGRPVTSSETWTWLRSPVFAATPLDMKAEADRHFLQGVNQLIGHGWPYSPNSAGYPGWRFYAAAVFNDNNPWWIAMPDITRYLQRMSYLLRQGHHVNDVALYMPNDDAWAHLKDTDLLETLRARVGPNTVARILEAGYVMDFFDDGTLESAGTIEKDALVMGGNRYRVIVLPGVETIPVATLRKLEAFAKGGGVLIATRRLPATAPGFKATEAENAEVKQLVARLFEGPNAPGRFVADENGGLRAALVKGLQPDMALSPAVPDMGFVHRRTEAGDIYFIANTGNLRQKTRATFRVNGMPAEWWDPMTGRTAPAEVTAGNTVALDVEPYGSRVLVFSRHAAVPKPAPAVTVPAPMDLSTGWQVTFGENGKHEKMDALRSWTEDEETRYFSGTATYEKEITVPEAFLRGGLQVRLDFGEGKPLPGDNQEITEKPGMRTFLDAPVREAAVVYVNGEKAGSVWCPPYALDIARLLRPGTNRLRVVVANLALNYMAGRALPDYHLLYLRYTERFQAQDMDKVQATPSGLFGPIRLVATAK